MTTIFWHRLVAAATIDTKWPIQFVWEMCPREWYTLCLVADRGYELTDKLFVDQEWGRGLERHIEELQRQKEERKHDA